MTKERLIEILDNLKPFKFNGDDDNIVEPPICDLELYRQYVIPRYIELGAIPKKDLIVGKTYRGGCRNASKAVWNGEMFDYKRYKWGQFWDDDILHFEDDPGNGVDVFVPIAEIE